MSVFYCDYHDRLEDADLVGYNEKEHKQYCDEAYDILLTEEEEEQEQEI